MQKTLIKRIKYEIDDFINNNLIKLENITFEFLLLNNAQLH